VDWTNVAESRNKWLAVCNGPSGSVNYGDPLTR